MAGTVLDTMFVDIIARGVTDAGKAIRGLTQETEVAAAANRRLRDAMSDVGRASQGMSGSRGSQSAAAGNSPQAAGIGLSQLSIAATLAAQALRQLRGAATGVQVAQPLFQATRVQEQVQKASLVKEPNITKELMGWGKSAGAALASITVAAAPFIMLMRQGLQGTVELERFNQAVGAVAREMANLIGPPMRMIADVILQGVSIFRQLGPAGQQLLGFVTGFGLLSTVLTDPALRGALNDLGAAFGDLMIASKPLIAQLANLGIAVVKIGIIEPLKMFAQVLTVAARGLSVFAENVVKGMRMFGLGFTMRDTGKRQELSLNQTGTEDAQASFARIQEAVLKAGMPATESEDVKQTSHLESISAGIEKIKTVAAIVEKYFAALGGGVTDAPTPGEFASGSGAVGKGVSRGGGRFGSAVRSVFK